MKKRNKKLLLALGTVTTVAAPVAAVVSCGTQETRHFNLLPTYTGQADQLIALGIKADYYPMQLNVQKPYAYLTNPGQYMTQQTDDFKGKFSAAIQNFMPKTQGVSWWNQDAKDSDDNRVDNTYWQKQEGSVLLYEHYLLDDGQKVVTSAWAPKHHSQTAVQTNFRASRDPYTRIAKGVFFGWDLEDSTIKLMAAGTAVSQDQITIQADGEKPAGPADATKMKPGAAAGSVDVTMPQGAGTVTVTVTSDDAAVIKAMRAKRKEFQDNGSKDSTWFYNDWFFVDSFHRTYLDNPAFQNSPFYNWIVDSAVQNPFETVSSGNATQLKTEQTALQQLFDASTYQQDEIANGLPHTSTAKVSSHHPIYEQQGGNIGAAPMFEGAMRDNQLYLFNVAWQVSNLANTGSAYGQQYIDTLPDTNPADAGVAKDFSGPRSKAEAKQIKEYVAKSVTPEQLTEMKGALTKANTITQQLKDRMAKIKTYLADLGVAGKTFGLMTIAPGKGVSTLQTNSKYSFIYNELGLSQPLPTNLEELGASADTFSKAWKVADGKATNQYMETTKDGDDDVYTVKEDSSTEGVNGIGAAVGAEALFNMDDNGWFWALGESKGFEGGQGLSQDKLQKFEGQIDFGVLASHDENFKAEISDNKATEVAVAKMFTSFKGKAGDANINAEATKFVEALRGENNNADYDLWNEGLKTPFVMDMLLDQIMTKAEEYAKANPTELSASAVTDSDALKTAKDAAANWGTYFTNDFLK